MSIVSFLSWERSDQAEASEGIKGFSIVGASLAESGSANNWPSCPGRSAKRVFAPGDPGIDAFFGRVTEKARRGWPGQARS